MPAKQTTASPKKASRRKDSDPILEQLQKTLNNLTKADLIDAVMTMAQNNSDLRDEFIDRLDVQIPLPPANKANLKAIIAATHEAIAKATWFDPKQINHNFDVDYRAYETVKRYLEQLVEARHFEPAVELAVELMSKGSYQVEMSDEGMMTEDIQKCLRPVAVGLNASGLPEATVDQWLEKIQGADRCRFIWSNDLMLPKTKHENQ